MPIERTPAAVAAAILFVLAGCSSPETPKKEVAVPKREPAPEVFTVQLDTSKGAVLIEVRKAWAPRGAEHFHTLVTTGFYDNARFFRMVRNFVVQFGINGDPKTHSLWATTALRDDPVKEKNRKGTLTFANRGPDTRTTQLFINLKDNFDLDARNFAPIGKVTSGMEIVESFYDSYGDMPPRGIGPDPAQIMTQGNEYLQNHFPRLDYIKKATVQ